MNQSGGHAWGRWETQRIWEGPLLSLHMRCSILPTGWPSLPPTPESSSSNTRMGAPCVVSSSSAVHTGSELRSLDASDVQFDKTAATLSISEDLHLCRGDPVGKGVRGGGV